LDPAGAGSSQLRDSAGMASLGEASPASLPGTPSTWRGTPGGG
jgi:hypothetical protein